MKFIEAALPGWEGRFYDIFFHRRNPVTKKLRAISVAVMLCLGVAMHEDDVAIEG